jgi:hypothetical protein
VVSEAALIRLRIIFNKQISKHCFN